jgi:hypothetical protein
VRTARRQDWRKLKLPRHLQTPAAPGSILDAVLKVEKSWQASQAKVAGAGKLEKILLVEKAGGIWEPRPLQFQRGTQFARKTQHSAGGPHQQPPWLLQEVDIEQKRY